MTKDDHGYPLYPSVRLGMVSYPKSRPLCPGGLPCDVSQGCPYDRIQCKESIERKAARHAAVLGSVLGEG